MPSNVGASEPDQSPEDIAEVSFEDLTKSWEERFPDGTVRMETLTIKSGTIRLRGQQMTKIYNIGAIEGKVVVLGDDNRIVTTIHEGLSTDDLREIGEAFALVRAEVNDLDSVSEKVRNRAIRAVQDAEDEAGDVRPDSNIIEQGLRRAKDVLESSGEVYDKSESWGKRLWELGTALAKVIPGAAGWLAVMLA